MENYNCAFLIKQIKDRINDQEFSDDVICSLLNSVQFEVLGEDKYQFLEKIHEYESIGSGELILPIDYQSTFQVLLDGQKLRYISKDIFFENPNPGCYTIYANKLFARSFNDESPAVLQHFYLAKPYYMGPDDEPIIPYEFMDVLIYGTLTLIERNRDNYDFAEMWHRHQDELILNMKKRYGMRQQGVSGRAYPHFRKMGRIY